MKKIIVEGHRGYAAKYPENTLISFEKAMELGVDAFEFDIWLSKDKIPVIMHDGNVQRITGVNKHLRDTTLEEIKELDAGSWKGEEFAGAKVPTLKEVLDLVKSKKPDFLLGMEIKEYTFETVDIAVEMLKTNNLFENCWFYAFNARIIKYLKQQHNARTMGYPDFQMKEFEADSYDYYDEIGLSMNLVKSEILDIYLKKGIPIHMYCADNENEVKLCVEKGASLITANDPVPLMNYLKKINGN